MLSGIPDDVWKNRNNWYYFLEHGGMYAPTRPHWFKISKLNPGQQRMLLAFLEEEFAGAARMPLIIVGLRNALGVLPEVIERERQG